MIMPHIPSVDLLNSTHQFPCVYTFKAIGLTSENFAVTALAAAGESKTSSERTTPDGKHVAVTIEVNAKSAEQVVAIYERLLKVTGLVILF